MTNKIYDDNTFNGWTNYATWRVHLEMFDGDSEFHEGSTAQVLQDFAESILESEIDGGHKSDNGGSLALSYAMAFIADVNWYEIAEHMNEEEPTS